MFRFVILIFFCATLSHAQGFAALTIIPKGGQQLDIATGITTLPEGGEVIDKKRGIKLSAAFIRYQEGVFVEAENGTAEGFFGIMQALSLNFDMASNTISSSQGVSFSQGGLSLTADTLTLYIGSSIAILSGHVKNEAPAFQAAAIIIKVGGGYALIASPFSYQDDAFALSQDAPGNLLQLKQIELEDGSFDYNVSTTPEEAILGELSPFLP